MGSINRGLREEQLVEKRLREIREKREREENAALQACQEPVHAEDENFEEPPDSGQSQPIKPMDMELDGIAADVARIQKTISDHCPVESVQKQEWDNWAMGDSAADLAKSIITIVRAVDEETMSREVLERELREKTNEISLLKQENVK